MSKWLVERLHDTAHKAVHDALIAAGLEQVEEFKLAPPAHESMGDLGLACHPFARILRKKPDLIAEDIAARITPGHGIQSVEAIKGYVNLRFDQAYMLSQAVLEVFDEATPLGKLTDHKGEKLLIEFSGPNTNKPQHLGHVRNNILGLATANLLEAAGYDVTRVNIINDRGIHICKSMLAYQLFGEGKTPESTGIKGDFFVGDHYVLFDQKYEAEYKASDAFQQWRQDHPPYAQFHDACEEWKAQHPDETLEKEDKDAILDGLGLNKEELDKLDTEHKKYKENYFNEVSPLGLAAKEMLRKWEDGDPEVRDLWQMMNNWVYDGFNQTYQRLGVHFDWVDYENETYVLGKAVVERGLAKGIFQILEDGATACDLTQIGREGSKVLLRPDGTSLYMTQDLGTANRRIEKFQPDRMLYVVADEQNYHFELLFSILNLLEAGLGDRCKHLSYGMVELPDGKMKSREGNVVDADNLMNDLHQLALLKVNENYPDITHEEKSERAEKIGQAGLKYFILKFTPSSRIHFDRDRSIENRGDTGPYCLYSFARINSIRDKMPEDFVELPPTLEQLATLTADEERQIGKLLMAFPLTIRFAAEQANPSYLTRYLHELASAFSTYYGAKDESGSIKYSIKDAPSPLREGRFALIRAIQKVLKRGLELLGIDTIERM